MRTLQKIIFILILWGIYSFGSIIAPIMAIFLIWYWNTRYMRNFILASDRLMAAMFGFSGRTTLSAELYFSKRLQWMRKMLDYIEPNHCINSCFTEHVYCRLTDHNLGSK
jgi:hypothetical protein